MAAAPGGRALRRGGRAARRREDGTCPLSPRSLPLSRRRDRRPPRAGLNRQVALRPGAARHASVRLREAGGTAPRGNAPSLLGQRLHVLPEQRALPARGKRRRAVRSGRLARRLASRRPRFETRGVLPPLRCRARRLQRPRSVPGQERMARAAAKASLPCPAALRRGRAAAAALGARPAPPCGRRL